MLIFSGDDNGNKWDKTWHIGEPKPILLYRNVLEVRAGGDELSYIEDRFTNLVTSASKVVLWRGEFARFIADNL